MPARLGAGGRYEIVRLLGRGGMGEVYLVQDRFDNHRELALKVLASRLKTGEKSRLSAEFFLLSMLSHPNLIKVFDLDFFGPKRASAFFTMEYVPGDNLAGQLNRLTIDQYFAVIARILQTLLYIHRRGILHLDLKPKNVLLPEQETRHIKIIYFGLAVIKARQGQEGHSQGSLGFLAPEILDRSVTADERADLFSLGALTINLFSGKLFRLFALPQARIFQLIDRFVPRKIRGFARQLLFIDRNKRFADSQAALDYFSDITGIQPQGLTKADYLDIINHNPLYQPTAISDKVLADITQHRGITIWLDGPQGCGKSRLLGDILINLKSRDYTILAIGQRRGWGRDKGLLSDLQHAGMLTAMEKQQLDAYQKRCLEQAKRTDMKTVVAGFTAKVVETLAGRLNEAVIAVDHAYYMSSFDQQVLRSFLRQLQRYHAIIRTSRTLKRGRRKGIHLPVPNLTREQTGEFVQLCLGMRRVNPRAVRALFEASSGNPRLLKQILTSSVYLGIKESPGGMMLQLSTRVFFRPSERREFYDREIAGLDLDLYDKKLLLLLAAYTRPMSKKELSRLLPPAKQNRASVHKLLRLRLVAEEEGAVRYVSYLPVETLEKQLTSCVTRDIYTHLCDTIQRQAAEESPLKAYDIFCKTNRRAQGIARLGRAVFALYQKGNAYNALDIVNIMLREVKGMDGQLLPIRYDAPVRLSPLPYFRALRQVDYADLLFIKSLLLHDIGHFQTAANLLGQTLSGLTRADRRLFARFWLAQNLMKQDDFKQAEDLFRGIIHDVKDVENYYYFHSLSQLCWICIQRGQFQGSETLLASHWPAGRKMPVTLRLIRTSLAFFRHDLQQARLELQAILRHSKQDVEEHVLAVIYNNLGILHKNWGHFEKARDYFSRSLEIKETIGAYQSQAKTMCNLAGVHLFLGRYAEADRWLHRTRKVSRIVHDSQSRITANLNLANLYLLKGEMEQAAKRLKEALFIASGKKDILSLVMIYDKLIDTALQAYRLDKALYYLDRLKRLLPALESWRHRLPYYLGRMSMALIVRDFPAFIRIRKQVANVPNLKRYTMSFCRFLLLLADFRFVLGQRDERLIAATLPLMERCLQQAVGPAFLHYRLKLYVLSRLLAPESTRDFSWPRSDDLPYVRRHVALVHGIENLLAPAKLPGTSLGEHVIELFEAFVPFYGPVFPDMCSRLIAICRTRGDNHACRCLQRLFLRHSRHVIKQVPARAGRFMRDPVCRDLRQAAKKY